MVENCTKAFDQLDLGADRSLCVDSLLLAEFEGKGTFTVEGEIQEEKGILKWIIK